MKLFAAIACPLLVCMCVFTAQSQSGRKISRVENKETTADSISIKTAEVSLSVIVRDTLGHAVKDLRAGDFTIYDNGKRYDPLRFDHREIAPKIVFLFDRSASAFTRQDVMYQALQGWRRALPSGSRLAVMQFNDEIELTQDWANDEEALRKGMRNTLRANGQAAIYDALTLATAKLAETSGRRIVLLFTTGLHQNGLVDQAQAMQSLREVGASLYVFCESEAVLSTLRKAKFESRELEQNLEQSENKLGELAENTGGKIFYPVQEQSFRWMLEEITDDLRGQYELSFSPDDTRAGSTHVIQVLVRGGHLSFTQASLEWSPNPSLHPFKQINAASHQAQPLTDKRFERTSNQYWARRLAHHAIYVRTE